ncbi:MAG: MCE family protein [Saprospiraceae bacterium]|nr:MCE family protein [Saprospiraceae bacterium]
MFLKGKNLLSKSDTFYAIFEDVTELSISAPVVLNGFKIGTVTNIQLDKKNVKQMIVTFIVEGNYSIPKNAIAAKKSVGVMGGRLFRLSLMRFVQVTTVPKVVILSLGKISVLSVPCLERTKSVNILLNSPFRQEVSLPI